MVIRGGGNHSAKLPTRILDAELTNEAGDSGEPEMTIKTFADCGGPFDLTPSHTISSWESKPTTPAEATVIAFLKSRPLVYMGKRLLHAGVGNCSLPDAVAGDLAGYIGLTISLPEKQLLQQKFVANKKVEVLLANKHDPRTYSKIEGRFDLIVDVNLKSFTCCEKHFHALVKFYADRLLTGGLLITAESGIQFGWKGNTNVAFTPGAQLDPTVAELRVLGRHGLERLSRHFDWTLTCARSATIAHATSDETLWLLKKD
jgi:hypothetical protein